MAEERSGIVTSTALLDRFLPRQGALPRGGHARTVGRHDETRFEYSELAPHPALRSFVSRYFSLVPMPGDHGSGSTEQPGVRAVSRVATICLTGARLLPSGDVSIVFDLRRTSATAQYGPWGPGRSVIIGPMARCLEVRVPAAVHLLGVTLRAGRSWAVVGLKAKDLRNRFEDLSKAWGPDTLEISEKLRANTDTLARVRLLEEELIRRLRTPLPSEDALCPVVETICQRSGNVRVSTLRLESGKTRQHLTRQFEEAVGLGPKTFARLVRFHRLLRGVLNADKPGWALLATESGFYDQAHMITEFRRLTGSSPAQFLGEIEP